MNLCLSSTLRGVRTGRFLGRCLFLPLFLWVSVCSGAVIDVPEDYKTIQSAIDSAKDGDRIIVAPGRYFENIHFNGKNIKLQSSDPTNLAVAAQTIIDAKDLDQGAVVVFSGAETSECVLAGFTITNGGYYLGGGVNGSGGIDDEHTHATIQYNIITGNSAVRGGGLLACDGLIENNIISSNDGSGTASGTGAGGGLQECHGLIQNNIIRDNHSEGGAGLSECHGTIRNNLIFDNRALGNRWYHSFGTGGGLADCDGVIENNTICFNSAYEKGGGLASCSGRIKNCIAWGNEAQVGAQIQESATPTYSCIQNWSQDGTGNLSAYPVFIQPASRDFRLAPDSPCIDAGGFVADVTEDFEGNPRPYPAMDWEMRGDGSGFDIGAYEFIGEATEYLRGDTNGDSALDLRDLFFFSEWWHDTANETNYRCDTEPDGVINETDYLILLPEWRTP